MKIDLKYSIIKSAFLVAILAAFEMCYAIPLCIFVTWGYTYVIALLFGVHVMPTMDNIVLIGDEKALVNFMSITEFDSIPFEKGRA
jgi:hypothetical protein